MELDGSRVLVTGASSGIGAAAAVAFAEAGATVGICARRADRLAEVLERCRASAPESRMWTVDLPDLDGLPAFAARADDELGGIDLLVNNAGVPKRRKMQELTLDDLEDVMRINFYSPFVLTLGVAPALLERGHGRIVNVSSTGTRMVALGVGAYAASKAALELYTEGLWADLLGTGVSAQLFVPGTTNTEFSTPREGDTFAAYADPNALDPADVAAALVAFVRTDDFEAYASERARRRTSAGEALRPERLPGRDRDAASRHAAGRNSRPVRAKNESREGDLNGEHSGQIRRQGRGGHRRGVGHRQGHGEPVRRRRRDGRLPRPQPCRRGGDRDVDPRRRVARPTPSASTSATPRTSTRWSSGSSRELGSRTSCATSPGSGASPGPRSSRSPTSAGSSA